MRILILGGNGMLGHKLVQQWRDQFDVWTTSRGNFEAVARLNIFEPKKTITGVSAENFDSIVKAFAAARPEVVINCIGVIKQLETAKDPIPTLNTNSIFPHRVANLCHISQTRFITLSTDCVFSGTRGNYSEADAPDAIDLYGRSKHLGEVTAENALTLRTSIIGREIESSHSLIEWFLSNQNGRIKGFTNAIYTGFPTIVLADILADIVQNHRNLNGVWHLSSEPISKYKLLCLVRDQFQINISIEPDTDFYCDRSLNSNRFRAATGFEPAAWAAMIEQMAFDPTPYDQWRKSQRSLEDRNL